MKDIIEENHNYAEFTIIDERDDFTLTTIMRMDKTVARIHYDETGKRIGKRSRTFDSLDAAKMYFYGMCCACRSMGMKLEDSYHYGPEE